MCRQLQLKSTPDFFWETIKFIWTWPIHENLSNRHSQQTAQKMTLNFVSVDSFLKMFANYELNGFRENIAWFFKGQYDDLTTCIVRLCRLEMQYHFTFFFSCDISGWGPSQTQCETGNFIGRQKYWKRIISIWKLPIYFGPM